MRATFHRCVTANCGLFPWQLEHFHEHAAHSGKSMFNYPRTSFEPHPKSFMLNAFSLQKASHCWKCLKLQSEKQSNLCFTTLFVKRPLCSLSKQLFLYWKHAPVFAIHSETARLWNGQKCQNEIYIFFIRILMHILMDFVLLYCQGSIHSSEREQKIISGDLFSCLMVSCAISWSSVPSLSWRLKRADEILWVLILNPAFQKSHS